ncbi:hypothetical protein R4144_18185, partial [Gordonia amicalis]|nr:hypothetical protein [Gordonia amicalis]
MPESNASVVVKQPLEKVWEFTTDPENAASYFPGTVELTSLSDGPVAVGTQWKGKTALLGRTMDWRGEYTLSFATAMGPPGLPRGWDHLGALLRML